ncbi:MAG: patatin-like phospholipase family protein [Salinarimonas sp.]
MSRHATTSAQATRRRAALAPRQREGRIAPRRDGPSVALALGSGGARGLAHVVVLETLDEMGIRPSAIVGCSMGAVVGAAYCAGIPAKALRRHALDTLEDRARVMARLMEARVGRLLDVFNGLGNPLLLDGEKVLDAFWPGGVPSRIEDLGIPFEAIACDFFARSEVVYAEGRLAPAVAGSMAIPGLFKPVAHEGRTLIDGGAVNPLPFDLLIGKADVVIAVDVAAGPSLDPSRLVSGLDVSFGAVEIMQEAIVQAKLKLACPQIMLRPPVQAFRALDFLEAEALFSAVEPMKDELKREIERQLALVAVGEASPATLGPPPTGAAPDADQLSG